MQMRQRDVAALDAKYTKELADAAENDVAWWCCRWSSSVAHQKQSVIMRVTTASGVDNAQLDWQTPLNGIISP